MSRRQSVFFLPIDPRDENLKDPEHIDFSVPLRAQYVHSAWNRHQDAVFWVDINIAIKEGLKPICDRSGQPDNTQEVFVVKGDTSRSQEIDVNYFHEELCSSDRSRKPHITRDVTSVQTCSSEENKNVRVEQTHFRSGQPDKHNVVVQEDHEVHHEIKMRNTDFKVPRQPKTSLRHDWTKELGSKVARQSEGEVARQSGEVARQSERRSCSTSRRGSCSTSRRGSCSTSRFFQSTQPIQIQFVTDRGDLITCKMEETRPVPTRSL